MLDSDPGQRPCSKPCRSKPKACCWWRSRTGSGPVGKKKKPGAILCAIRFAGANAWGLARPPITLTHHLPQSGCDPAFANRLRQGDRQAVLDQKLEQLGANDKHSPGCAARPPGLPAELKVRIAEAQREGWPTRQAFSPEKPWQRCSRNGPAACQFGGLRAALAPCRRGPWGTEELQIAAASKDQGGRGCASWPIRARRFFATRNQPGEDSGPNGDVGVVVGNSHRPSSAVPRAGRQQSTKTCGWVHPARWRGRKPPSP